MDNQELDDKDKAILRQHYADEMKAARVAYMEAVAKYRQYGGTADEPLVPANNTPQLNLPLKEKEPFKWKKTSVDTVRDIMFPMRTVDIYDVNEESIIKANEPRDKAVRSISSSLYYLVQEGELYKLKIEGENEYYYADPSWFEGDKLLDRFNPYSLVVVEVIKK